MFVSSLTMAAAQQVGVEAKIDSVAIMIGEQAHLQLTITARQGAKIVYPHYKRSQYLVPGVEVLDDTKGDTAVVDGYWSVKKILTLTSFDPDDEEMFMRNARDFTSRMRRHPSIALYCGRNEGYPPKTLDDALRKTVAEMNPNMLYISSSADEGVSGHGPYWAEPARTYFAKQSGKLHTERGMPNIMTPEGTHKTLGNTVEWRPGDAWGQHDFTQAGAQRGASFMAIVENMFGKITSADEFTRLAQWQNYEGYRAMYEADSKYLQGLLIWMSHACWPSYTWQCYDYYFEPTAAFYGARKACEPLHIQRNALTRNIEIVNRIDVNHKGLVATRELYGNSKSKVPYILGAWKGGHIVLSPHP